VEETTGKAKKVNQQKCLLLTAYDETIMAHPSVKVKYYLCAAPCFSRRPWQGVVWRMQVTLIQRLAVYIVYVLHNMQSFWRACLVLLLSKNAATQHSHELPAVGALRLQ